jgi:hypothetical protein
MALKSLPFKWTCLLGGCFLGSIFWSAASLDAGFGFLRFLVFGFCFFISLVSSLVLAVANRSRMSLYGVLINVAVCLLFFPTIRAGGMLRDQLFLKHLARFQEVTDFLIENERARANTGEFLTMAHLPSGYSDLNVAGTVLIKSAKENITVEYLVQETSALGHSGYIYRLDDNTNALEKDYPRIGYTRLAPHWFFFSD